MFHRAALPACLLAGLTGAPGVAEDHLPSFGNGLSTTRQTTVATGLVTFAAVLLGGTSGGISGTLSPGGAISSAPIGAPPAARDRAPSAEVRPTSPASNALKPVFMAPSPLPDAAPIPPASPGGTSGGNTSSGAIVWTWGNSTIPTTSSTTSSGLNWGSISPNAGSSTSTTFSTR